MTANLAPPARVWTSSTVRQPSHSIHGHRRGGFGDAVHLGTVAEDLERHLWSELLPGAKERRDAFLRRQPPGEQGVAARAISRIGGRAQKVGVDVERVRIEAGLEEFGVDEAVGRPVRIDFPGPGADAAVHGGHRGDHRAAKTTSSVTTVPDAGPSEALAQAVLAHLTVAIEDGRGAHDAEVVEHLEHRHAFGVTGVVRGRRHQREGVLEMCDVGSGRADQPAQFSVGGAIPHRGGRRRHLAHRGDGIVVQGERDHLVAMVFEHCAGRGEALIFTARQLVEVVHVQDAHSALH